MASELYTRNLSQQHYNRALSQQWRNTVQLYEPALWLSREPDIEEQMLRDDVIAQAVGYRRALIAGRQWTLTPRDASDDAAQLAVDVGSEIIGCIKKFTEARRMLARAFFSGARFAKIHATPKRLTIGDGKERTWWVPTRLEDIDKRRFRRVPQHDENGQLVGATWEMWDIGKSDWIPQTIDDAICTIRHVYEDDEGTTGHGRALREPLGFAWYTRAHLLAERNIACEKHGAGMLVARVDGARDADGTPNSTVVENWLDNLENARARHVLVHDSRDSVEMVSQQGTGWQLLGQALEDCNNRILTLILQANLTTSADSGGSYALAEVQENSTEAMIQYDRESLEETLTDDLLGAIWYYNRPNLVELGIADQMPRFAIVQEKRHDPVQRAQVAQTLSAMGVTIAADDLYEQTGFRRPEEGEPVIKPQERSAPMPGGGGFPFYRSADWRDDYQAFASDWDESKHPRDGGKFAPSEGQRGEPDEFEAAMADATKYARGAFRAEKDKLTSKAEMAASAIDDRYGYRVTELIDQIENTSTDDPDAADESLSAIEDKLDALEEKVEAAIEDRVERITSRFESRVRDAMDDRFSDQMAGMGAEDEFGALIETVDKWADALPAHVEKVVRSVSDAAGNVAHARELIAELRGEI